MVTATTNAAPRVHPALDNTVVKLLDASMASSTHRLYNKVVTSFSVYLLKYFSIPMYIPLKVHHIMGYVAYLHHKGYSGSTIASYISALSYFHKIRGSPDPTNSYLIRKLIMGSSSLTKPSRVHLPITQQVLHTLISSVSCLSLSQYNVIMLQSMFYLAFHAFLRVGELTRSSASNHTLQLNDVSLVQGQSRYIKIIVSFKSFKHKKDYYPTSIVIQSKEAHCPVLSLVRYLRIRPKFPGPLYIFSDKSPVTSSFFYSSLRQCLLHSGLDPLQHRGHSFRIGAATMAASMGYSETQISAMSRWNSNAFKKYVRIPSIS